MTTANMAHMDKESLAEYTSKCIECEACLEVCCTYESTEDTKLSPMGRLNIIDTYIKENSISPENSEAIYLCTDCGRCETVCPVELPISEIIADSKILLVAAGDGPLDKHNKMTAALIKNRNAVNGNPEKRLDWIPEKYRDTVKFEDAPGDTLFYAGCLSSFLDKKTAAASFEILMAAGIDFKIMKDEYCCGIYPYNAGKLTEARAIFTEMNGVFKTSGIKRIIIPCAGCHRTFSSYYPKLIEDFDIEIIHMAELIPTLIKEKKISLGKIKGKVTLHDACKTGRKYGLYQQPRDILIHCGYEIDELPENKENAPCCGSGAGVRSINPVLSMKIAEKIVSDCNAPLIVSTCPFCIFNFNYTARKKELNKKAIHISTLVRDALVRDALVRDALES